VLDYYLRLEIDERRGLDSPKPPPELIEQRWPLKGQPKDERDPLMHIIVECKRESRTGLSQVKDASNQWVTEVTGQMMLVFY